MRPISGCLGIVVLLAAGVARGQDAPWPEALRQRNARYASLQREQDAAGDRDELRRLDRVLTRGHDALGDQEEQRRALAASRIPPRATVDAVVARDADGADDSREQVLAGLTHARREALLSRYRDFSGDSREAEVWRVQRVRFGPLRWGQERIGLGDVGDDPAGRQFRDARSFDAGELDTPRQRERELETQEERRDERAIEGSLERSLGEWVLDERDEAAAERELERSESRDEARLERESDDAEGALERELDDAEGALERSLEKDEVHLDRQLERSAERQLQQEEERTLQDKD